MRQKFFSFLLMVMLCVHSGMAVTTVTFTSSDFNGQGTSGTGSNVSATKNGVTFSCDKGYGAQSAVRCYKDASVSISSSSTVISSINFEFETYNNKYYNGGLSENVAVNDYSWQNTMASQARMTSITVYLSDASSQPVTSGIDSEGFAYISDFTYASDLISYDGAGGFSSIQNPSLSMLKANVFCVEDFYGLSEGQSFADFDVYKNTSLVKLGEFNFCWKWYRLSLGEGSSKSFDFTYAYDNMNVGDTKVITSDEGTIYTIKLIDKVQSTIDSKKKIAFSVDRPLYFGGIKNGSVGISNFRDRVQVKYVSDINITFTGPTDISQYTDEGIEKVFSNDNNINIPMTYLAYKNNTSGSIMNCIVIQSPSGVEYNLYSPDLYNTNSSNAYDYDNTPIVPYLYEANGYIYIDLQRKEAGTWHLMLVQESAGNWLYYYGGSSSGEPTVTQADLASYEKSGYYVACFQAPANSTCNDIVWAGSYNGWATDDVSQLIHCTPLPNFPGWYVAVVPTGDGNEGKPVQLDECGLFNWDNQCGNMDAVTLLAGYVNINISMYSDECNMDSWSASEPTIIKISSWKNGANPCNKTCTPKYTITVVSANPEYGSASGSTTVDYLTQTTISANANYGYHFTQWDDGNTQNPRTVTVTEDATYTASFAKNNYIITTTSSNQSWGNATGGKTAAYLDQITITANANFGYHFTRWNDGNTQNPRTVTVTKDATYTASFDINIYTINVISEDDHIGMVMGSGMYEAFTEVNVMAAACQDGYKWSHWSDGVQLAGRKVVLTSDTTLVAYFSNAEESCVEVDVNNHSLGQADILVMATPNEGARFVQWEDGETSNPRVVTYLDPAKYIAIFTAENNLSSVAPLSTSQEDGTMKIIRDNQVYILRGDKIYTLQGQELK